MNQYIETMNKEVKSIYITMRTNKMDANPEYWEPIMSSLSRAEFAERLLDILYREIDNE